MILGGGPNRIGQGIEFDYCCVHAAFALKRRRLRDHHGQLQPGDGLHRLRHLRPALLRAADARGRAGRSSSSEKPDGRHRPVRRPDAAQAGRCRSSRRACRSSARRPTRIDRAEDRERFGAAARPSSACASRANGIARTVDGGGRRSPSGIGYPVLVRPSYVLGGRAMEIVYDDDEPARATCERAVEVVARAPGPDRQVPRGRHRGRRGRRLRRRRRRRRRHHGAHRGGRRPLRRQRLRAAAVLASAPSVHRRDPAADQRAWRASSSVGGLMNVQFAVKDGEVYVLEVNPRASRTVPFVSKAIGVPLAKLAARVMVGRDARASWASPRRSCPTHVAVKEAVFPFVKFPGVDTVLGPGDEVDRRGDGHRRRLRRRLRQGADRGRHASCRAAGTRLPQRARTPTSRRWCRSRSAWRAPASASSPPRGTGGVPARARHRRRAASTRSQEGSPHVVDALRARRASHWSSTRRQGPRRASRLVPDPAHRARVQGAVLHDHRRRRRRRRGRSSTCAARRLSVRSLQEYHGRG